MIWIFLNSMFVEFYMLFFMNKVGFLCIHACNAGDAGDMVSIPGSGRSLGGGHGN